MIKLDYTYSSIKLHDLKQYQYDITNIVEAFLKKECQGSDYLGWYDLPLSMQNDEIEKILLAAEEIRKSSEVLVVCGIGGSYLGARALIEAIKGFYGSDLEIIYLGNSFDERYTKDVLNYLINKDFSVNVISKSGGTLETAFAFRLLKELLEKKYGKNAYKRIYATTDEKKGCLRQMTQKENYTSFIIPSNVGGRYSVFSAVGLLPLAVAGVDIKKLISGAIMAYQDFQNTDIEQNIAYQYAAYRHYQYKHNNKKVEVFATYSPYLNIVAEWWKQLFGESEGKEEKGLFPASVNFSTDLHSLGQFIQQGSKILFISQIKLNEKGNLCVKEDDENIDDLNYLKNISLQEINNAAQEGSNKAHYEDGNVDNLRFIAEKVDEVNMGYLFFMLMCSCMISAYLLDVNPFDQPGVEFYKKEMKKIIKNI